MSSGEVLSPIVPLAKRRRERERSSEESRSELRDGEKERSSLRVASGGHIVPAQCLFCRCELRVGHTLVYESRPRHRGRTRPELPVSSRKILSRLKKSSQDRLLLASWRRSPCRSAPDRRAAPLYPRWLRLVPFPPPSRLPSPPLSPLGAAARTTGCQSVVDGAQ